MCDAETQFFRDIVEGVVREQRRIDPLVDRHLAEGWRLNRVDSILRAILRAGAYEMLMRKDVPSRVVYHRICRSGACLLRGRRARRWSTAILDKLGHEDTAARIRPSGLRRCPTAAAKARRAASSPSSPRYFAPLATNPAALGLLDDAAVLSIPEGQELVATCDTITAGVHFLTNDPPDTVGYQGAFRQPLRSRGQRRAAVYLPLERWPCPTFRSRPGSRPFVMRPPDGTSRVPASSSVGGDTCATLRAAHDLRSPRSAWAAARASSVLRRGRHGRRPSLMSAVPSAMLRSG